LKSSERRTILCLHWCNPSTAQQLFCSSSASPYKAPTRRPTPERPLYDLSYRCSFHFLYSAFRSPFGTGVAGALPRQMQSAINLPRCSLHPRVGKNSFQSLTRPNSRHGLLCFPPCPNQCHAHVVRRHLQILRNLSAALIQDIPGDEKIPRFFIQGAPDPG